MNDEEKVRQLLGDLHFDVVADFIIFNVEQLERDIRLFSGRTDQYIFISSASAYQEAGGESVDHGVYSAVQPLLGV